MKSGSRGVQKNLFDDFWTFLQVSTNFETLHYFLRIKTIENDLKIAAPYWAKIGLRLQRAA
jgi:hypothetical protein